MHLGKISQYEDSLWVSYELSYFIGEIGCQYILTIFDHRLCQNFTTTQTAHLNLHNFSVIHWNVRLTFYSYTSCVQLPLVNNPGNFFQILNVIYHKGHEAI